jgi:antitoxin YefM
MLSAETTYTYARSHLASLLKQVVDNREIAIIKRRDGKNVALIAEDELSSLLETVYLLRSPRNAKRLLDALERAKAGATKPQTIEELCQELGIVRQEKAAKKAVSD